MYRQTKNGLGKHWDFIIVDIFALELSLFLAYFTRNGGSLPMGDSLYRNLILFLPMLHIVVAFVFGGWLFAALFLYCPDYRSVFQNRFGFDGHF